MSINPNKVRTITKGLNIDTIFRENMENSSPSDFMFKLNEPINNAVSIKLSAIELPNMWYAFSSHNKSNTFTIHCFNIPPDVTGSPATNATYNINIPDGNYLANNFQDMINNLFVNSGGGLKYIHFEVNEYTTNSSFRAVHGDDGQGVNPYSNGKTDFSFSIDFAVQGQLLIKTAGWNLGFRQPSYTVDYNDQYSDFVTNNEMVAVHNAYVASESSFGSSVHQYVFLELVDYKRNSVTDAIVSGLPNSYLGNDILARITVSSGQNTIVLDNASDLVFKKRCYFGPQNLEKFHVRLLDKYGDVIDLNYNNFSFMLEIEQNYSS